MFLKSCRESIDQNQLTGSWADELEGTPPYNESRDISDAWPFTWPADWIGNGKGRQIEL